MSMVSDFLRGEGYEVTEDGTVFSRLTGHPSGQSEIKSHADKDGYRQVSLTSRYGRKSFKVHTLVAEFHLPPRPSPFHEVRHLDGSRDNNHVSNLAWGTKSENCQDRTSHRLLRQQNKCRNGHSRDEHPKTKFGTCSECERLQRVKRENKRKSSLAPRGKEMASHG